VINLTKRVPLFLAGVVFESQNQACCEEAPWRRPTMTSGALAIAL
jgi:hypothetical protein